MRKPIHRHFDANRRTSMLYFDDGEHGEYYMRGGICFPIKYPVFMEEGSQGFDIKGFALMAGQNLQTGRVMVFEQMEWVAIDDVLEPDNRIQYPGLSHWLNMIWNKYFGQTFYFAQSDAISRTHRLRVLRSPMVNPKPRIVELITTDSEEALFAVLRCLQAKKLGYGKDSVLDRQLIQSLNNDKVMLPAVHALGCCIAGLELYPWRKPYERSIQEILIPS